MPINSFISFSLINLEDIKAPECFDIEKALVDQLDIPVLHDDQHGTAIVTAASSRAVGRTQSQCLFCIFS